MYVCISEFNYNGLYSLGRYLYSSESLIQFSYMYRGADKSLARPGRKQATATEDFDFIYPIYNHNWRNINIIYMYMYIYISRLASKEIFSP